VYKILARKPERKRPLTGPSHGWEDNIRRYFREIGWESMNWIHLVQEMYSGRLL
jgi:hypothetical protein